VTVIFRRALRPLLSSPSQSRCGTDRLLVERPLGEVTAFFFLSPFSLLGGREKNVTADMVGDPTRFPLFLLRSVPTSHAGMRTARPTAFFFLFPSFFFLFEPFTKTNAYTKRRFGGSGGLLLFPFPWGKRGGKKRRSKEYSFGGGRLFWLIGRRTPGRKGV